MIGPDSDLDDPNRARLHAVLDRLGPAPALVINRIGDVVAANRAGRLLFEPVGMLDRSPANLSRYVFTDPRAKAAFPDWDSVADRVAVQLRLDTCEATGPLIEEMTAAVGPVFSDRLAGSFVPDRHGYVRLDHPQAGQLRLTYETLDVFVAEPQHLLLYLPADEATTRSLDQLIADSDR